MRPFIGLARHYRRSPEQISAPEVQDYLLFLHQQRGLSWPICNTVRHGVRFFFRITLRVHNVLYVAISLPYNPPMFPDLLPAEGAARPALPAHRTAAPVLFSPSPHAERRFWEFFTAHIRNPNTRLAYFTAARRFAAWCERRGLALHQVEPMVVAAYIEQLSGALSAPSVKQHLAALRMLFDWLVVGQVLPFNPASSVRGPKHVVKTGKTPVLSAAEIRELLDGIDVTTLAGLRDRALLGVLVYSFARVTAAVSMHVADYYTQGPRSFFRLPRKRRPLQHGAGPTTPPRPTSTPTSKPPASPRTTAAPSSAPARLGATTPSFPSR